MFRVLIAELFGFLVIALVIAVVLIVVVPRVMRFVKGALVRGRMGAVKDLSGLASEARTVTGQTQSGSTDKEAVKKAANDVKAVETAIKASKEAERIL